MSDFFNKYIPIEDGSNFENMMSNENFKKIKCIKLAGRILLSHLQMWLCLNITVVFLHNHISIIGILNNSKCYRIYIRTVIMENGDKLLK